MSDIQSSLVMDWAVSFVREQSEGEWDEKTILADAKKMTDQILDRLPQWRAVQGL